MQPGPSEHPAECQGGEEDCSDLIYMDKKDIYESWSAFLDVRPLFQPILQAPACVWTDTQYARVVGEINTA